MNILALDLKLTSDLLERVQRSYSIRDEDLVGLVCHDRIFYNIITEILQEKLGYEHDEYIQLWKRKGYDERGRLCPPDLETVYEDTGPTLEECKGKFDNTEAFRNVNTKKNDERKARVLFPDSKINTPKAHVHHNSGDNCGCATTFEEVFYECRKCGAHYDHEPVSFFKSWLCYDCGVHVELMPVEKEEGS